MRIFSDTAVLPESDRSETISVICTLGESRMFRIVKAQLGSKFVILKTPVCADAMMTALLRREYELSAGLNHPCIVGTLGYEDSTPAGPAIILEYIEGRTLDEFIATAPTQSERERVMKDILDGVDYLHHKGVLHNDLKPDNIVVNSNGNARIIDFGLSGSDDSIYKGVSGGSAGYSAPEVLDGRGPAGAASDIYSLGLLINFISGGSRYRRITARCRRQDPSERPQSVDELRKLLSRKRKADLYSIFIAAFAAVIVLVLTYPAIRNRTNENTVYSLEEKYEAELAPRFDEAVKMMKRQEYMEFAMIIQQEYMEYGLKYLDSLGRLYPTKDTGEVPPEISALCAVLRRNQEYTDSLIYSLPSVNTLPANERDPLWEMAADGEVPGR